MVGFVNTFSSTVDGAISIIGFTSMILGFIYIGKKLQVLDDLKETVGKIKYNVKVSADFLTKKEPEVDHSKLQSYSPFHLTKEGEEFIILLGFDRVFGEHKKEFFNFIDEEAPQVKYDVELSAIKSIYFLLDKPFMNLLKTYMYNHPEKRINSIAPTLGVYIRDHYLAEHAEIN